ELDVGVDVVAGHRLPACSGVNSLAGLAALRPALALGVIAFGVGLVLHDGAVDAADIVDLPAAADELAHGAVGVDDAIDERPLLEVRLIARLRSQPDGGDDPADLLVALAVHPGV